MKVLKILASLVVVSFFAGTLSAQTEDRDNGINLYREGRFADAVAMLEKAVAANKTDRAAWIYLGGAYKHVDQDNKALKAFAHWRGKSEVSQPTYERSVKFTYKPVAKYTDEARRNNSSGTVTIAVELRADGKIGFLVPLQTMSQDLVRPAMDAAQQIRFEPAIKDGKPVTVINMIEYGFWMG